MEMGFDLHHLRLLTEKENKMLKNISQDFEHGKNEQGHDALAQVTLDDNVFNSACARFTSVDKQHSIRSSLGNNTKTKPFVEFLTSKMISKAIPSLAEEYGANKEIDIVFSLTHSRFQRAFPQAKRTNV